MMRRPSAVAKSTPKDPNMWLPIRARECLSSSASANQPMSATPARATSASATSTLAPSPVRSRRYKALVTDEAVSMPVIEIPCRQHVVDRYGRLRRTGHQGHADLCVDRVVDRRLPLRRPCTWT